MCSSVAFTKVPSKIWSCHWREKYENDPFSVSEKDRIFNHFYENQKNKWNIWTEICNVFGLWNWKYIDACRCFPKKPNYGYRVWCPPLEVEPFCHISESFRNISKLSDVIVDLGQFWSPHKYWKDNLYVINTFDFHQSVQYSQNPYLTAMFMVLATWKDQATDLVVKLVIPWLVQSSYGAPRRGTGVIIFLCVLEVKVKTYFVGMILRRKKTLVTLPREPYIVIIHSIVNDIQITVQGQ